MSFETVPHFNAQRIVVRRNSIVLWLTKDPKINKGILSSFGVFGSPETPRIWRWQ
jgi:hypothetical protein